MAQEQPTPLSHRQRAVRGLAIAASLAVTVTGCGMSASASSGAAPVHAAAAALPATPRAPATTQNLRQVWPAGASTSWAWTANMSGRGAQGIERTTDGGTHWTDVTPPGLGDQVGDHYINGFFALGADHAWVTFGGVSEADTQSIAGTSDGGRHWTVVGHQPNFDTCDLDFVTPSDGWCAVITAYQGYETVTLYRTTDDGEHWRIVSKTGTGSNPPGSLPYVGDKNIQFVSETIGWTVFAFPADVPPLYETTNGGTTWVARHVTKPSGALENGSGFTGQPLVEGKNGAVGYTISGPTPKSDVYVTTDGGAHWRPVTPPGPPEGWLVDTITPLSWRLVNGHRILATDDGGKTWRTITSNAGFHLFYAYDSPTPPVVDFVTSEVGWIVLQTPVTTTLWRTTDGGSTWLRVRVPGT